MNLHPPRSVPHVFRVGGAGVDHVSILYAMRRAAPLELAQMHPEFAALMANAIERKK